MTHCHEHLQVKMHGQKGRVWDTLTHYSFHAEMFSMLCPSLFIFYFILFIPLVGGRLQGWRVNTRGQRNEWNWGTGCETHKKINKKL
jgi:hypothetical protein